MSCAHDWAWYGWMKPMSPPIYLYRCEECGEEGWGSAAPPDSGPIEPKGFRYDHIHSFGHRVAMPLRPEHQLREGEA